MTDEALAQVFLDANDNNVDTVKSDAVKRTAYDRLIPHIIADFFAKYDDFHPAQKPKLDQIEFGGKMQEALKLDLKVDPGQLTHLNFDHGGDGYMIFAIRSTGQLVAQVKLHGKQQPAAVLVALDALPLGTLMNIYGKIAQKGDGKFRNDYHNRLRKAKSDQVRPTRPQIASDKYKFP